MMGFTAPVEAVAHFFIEVRRETGQFHPSGFQFPLFSRTDFQKKSIYGKFCAF
jgi:hypothetical protein